MAKELEHDGTTFYTKSGRPFVVRQLISDDITILHAQNAFQNDFITIDDMVFESIITHPEYGQRMLVALLDGQIIGKLRIGLEQSDIDSKYIGKLGFMRDLSVLPQLRSDGVGSALVDFGESVIRNEKRDHAGLRFTPETLRPLQFFLERGYREMFMEFPDAFDLYKALDQRPEQLNEDELSRLVGSVISRARSVCHEQGMADDFDWKLSK